jgi:hypothetical protein
MGGLLDRTLARGMPEPTNTPHIIVLLCDLFFGSSFFCGSAAKSGLVRHVLRSVADIQLDTHTR